MINILLPLQELIKSSDKKTDEQLDTTNMSELESAESANKEEINKEKV